MQSTEWKKNHREYLARKQREYRLRGGWRVQRERNIRLGILNSEPTKVFLVIIRDLIQETRNAVKEFNRSIRKAEAVEISIKREQRRLRVPFINKIFQFGICVDCGVGFVTLYPPELVAFGVVNPHGVIRCKACIRQRRLKNHGGGPRRRCTQFGVPYEIISPGAIFHRDEYKCKLCGGDLDMSAGFRDSKAAEIDHIIPLSVPGSPGHVLSNVQSTHRVCNINKGARWNEV